MPSASESIARPPAPRYADRIYAGILGKMIGVYLGRPVEQWEHAAIVERFGFVDRYVAGELGLPVVVPDDDLSGTFVFARAAEDCDSLAELDSRRIAQIWLNDIVEGRTTLWWGGFGNSTEHTAFARLKAGVPPPRSGSVGLNGAVLANQVGAQIFVEGWAFLAAGDRALAARLARQAASVSHDGDALDAAAAMAAMQTAAFEAETLRDIVEAARQAAGDGGTIRAVIDDVANWSSAKGDWRDIRAAIEQRYGPGRYGGNCHIVPNFALVLLGLLAGGGDFRRSLAITVTAGWDTDSNAGNVGAILGIWLGPALIEQARDLVEPLGDRLFVSSADGAGAISDAARLTDRFQSLAARLGDRPGQAPESRARFHFGYPTSTQGFVASRDAADAEAHHRPPRNEGSLLVLPLANARPVHLTTAVFPAPRDFDSPPYALSATPILHPGDRIEAVIRQVDGAAPITVAPTVLLRMEAATLETLSGPETRLAPGRTVPLRWTLPDFASGHVERVGITAHASGPASIGLESLDWRHRPSFAYVPDPLNDMADRLFVTNADWFQGASRHRTVRMAHAGADGIALYGPRDWAGYEVSATLSSDLYESFGLLAAVRGLRRFLAIICDRRGEVRLELRRDGETRCLAAAPGGPYPGHRVEVELDLASETVRGRVGETVLTSDLPTAGLSGGIGFLVAGGTVEVHGFRLRSDEAG